MRLRRGYVCTEHPGEGNARDAAEWWGVRQQERTDKEEELQWINIEQWRDNAEIGTHHRPMPVVPPADRSDQSAARTSSMECSQCCPQRAALGMELRRLPRALLGCIIY